MLSYSVHHDTKSENVASHNENRKQNLSETEQLASKGTHQNFTSICQILNVGIGLMELADNIAGIRGENTQPNNENDGTREGQFTCLRDVWSHETHGTRPSSARVAGNDRTPSDTDSAIITKLVSYASFWPCKVTFDIHIPVCLERNGQLTA